LAHDLFNRYIWLIDTIRRYGRITLDELGRQWLRSPLSDGKPLPRRTFHHYRIGAEEMFGVNIQCDRSTYEYYIQDTPMSELHRWLIDATALTDTLRDTSDIAGRVVLENVPSAREHLPTIIDALRQNHRIHFNYRSYMRSQRSQVDLEPYFVKIFKQLWYVIGYNVKDQMIKTYALDRMSDLVIDPDKSFDYPEGLSPQEFFKDCFGITTNQNDAKRIVLRVEPTQAKYFRALPLHPSQQEVVHDHYSVFTYQMRITYDLREELLSHGSSIEVLEPLELKLMIKNELSKALEQYN
jgi:predicted DNA-binding transcriptional regulator YafY